MAAKQPMPGPGQFQWNKGGWFGGQIGCTAWMLVGAIVLIPHAPGVSVLWLTCFIAANAVGTWLWRRRDRLEPFPAIQVQLLTCGVMSLLALVALHVIRPGLLVNQPAGVWLADEPRLILQVLAMYIVLMAFFYLMERGAKKQKARWQDRHSV